MRSVASFCPGKGAGGEILSKTDRSLLTRCQEGDVLICLLWEILDKWSWGRERVFVAGGVRDGGGGEVCARYLPIRVKGERVGTKLGLGLGPRLRARARARDDGKGFL